jgi:hypothetical protein
MSQETVTEEWRKGADGKRAFEPDGEEHDLDSLLGDDYIIINGKSKRPVLDGRADRGPRDEEKADAPRPRRH